MPITIVSGKTFWVGGQSSSASRAGVDAALSRYYRPLCDGGVRYASAASQAGMSPCAAADWDMACARLRAAPLVYVSYMPQALTLRERLEVAQLLPARQLRCDDLELAKSLAFEGVGVTILPRRVAATEQEQRLQRLHPALPLMPDVVYLAQSGRWISQPCGHAPERCPCRAWAPLRRRCGKSTDPAGDRRGSTSPSCAAAAGLMAPPSAAPGCL